MIIEYNKTISLSVVSRHEGEKLCKVKDFIIESQDGKFLGLFCLKTGFIFSTKFFIKNSNIENFGGNAIMVKDKNALENPYKISQILNLLKEKTKIKNNKVLTESGDDLGEVKNYTIETINNKLVNIIVSGGIFRDFLRGELIIPREQIISIGPDAIIVKDAVIKEKEKIKSQIKPKEELAQAGMWIKKNNFSP